MLYLSLSAFIACIFIESIQRIQNIKAEADGISTISLVVTPIILNFIIGKVIAIFELPSWLGIAALPIILIIPLLMLRISWRLAWGRSIAYLSIILLSILSIELIFTTVFGLANT